MTVYFVRNNPKTFFFVIFSSLILDRHAILPAEVLRVTTDSWSAHQHKQKRGKFLIRNQNTMLNLKRNPCAGISHSVPSGRPGSFWLYYHSLFSDDSSDGETGAHAIIQHYKSVVFVLFWSEIGKHFDHWSLVI